VPEGVQSFDSLKVGRGGTPRLMLRQNPVRGSARVQYVLPQASGFRLEAFDRSGRRIAVLASGYSAAGAHHTTWDTRDVPAGVYFLRLTTSGSRQSLKAVVSR
jgi:hypothetical protein